MLQFLKVPCIANIFLGTMLLGERPQDCVLHTFSVHKWQLFTDYALTKSLVLKAFVSNQAHPEDTAVQV